MNLRSYFPALRSALGYGIYSPAPDDLRRIEMTQHLAKRLGWIP
ncbi:MAG TPA: hypothetical protein PK765_05160 [bacterium]|nr:hypothetical protein [bacterium]